MLNPYEIKKDFPMFNAEQNHNLIYLDNAATTQKPTQVLNAIRDYYTSFNANPHRGAHRLSYLSTETYEKGRQNVADFIHSPDANSIVFTHNTTEAINMVARSFLGPLLKENDHITLSITDHHSCMLPPLSIAREKGAHADYLQLSSDYTLPLEEIEAKIHAKTKMVFIGHYSNVLGIPLPVEAIIKRAREVGAYVLIDGAQAVPHMPIDVTELDADFYTFSAHKMLGPMGIGVLYGKYNLLQRMLPYNYGGNMVNFVDEEEISYKDAPHGLEAGTQNVEGVHAFSAAIDYLRQVGMDNIHAHQQQLITYAVEKLKEVPGIELYIPEDITCLSGLISFNMDNVHPHDVASILDMRGIAIRSGFHCAQPLMKSLELPSTCRASFYIYNSKEDVDALVEGLKEVRRLFS